MYFNYIGKNNIIKVDEKIYLINLSNYFLSKKLILGDDIMKKNAYEIQYDMEDKEYDNMMNTLDKMLYNNVIKPYKDSSKVIDLHTHTIYSDGELTPDELIREAIDKKVGILSITDHNTIDGIKSVNKNNKLIKKTGIKIVDGIELSAKFNNGKMHILGYDIDINNENLNKKLYEIKNNSFNTFLSTIEQVKRDYNISFSYDDIKDIIVNKNMCGRVDIAKLLVKYGYANSVKEAFDKYLESSYKKINNLIIKPSYEECLNLITSSGGIAVLAHPKSLKVSNAEFSSLIENMKHYGLSGIEAYHSSHTSDEMAYYVDAAKKHDLLASCGSDFHGKNVKPDISLGSGKNNNLNVKKLELIKRFK